MSRPELEELFEKARRSFVEGQEVLDRLEGDPDRIQTRRILDAKRFAEERARKSRAGRSKRGKVRVSDEKLEEALARVREENPRLSWTDACSMAARRVGYKDGRTLRDRIPHTRW